MQDVRGYNPYKFGMAGGSDSHNTGSPYRQDNFYGLHADADGSVERRFAGVLIGGSMDVRLENPGGLTGQNFTADGQQIVFRVGFGAVAPSGYGKLAQDGYEGITSHYRIAGGKLITLVSQDPYAFTFYELGGTYYVARSNEFGYANYELIPAPQIAASPLAAVSNQFSIELGLTEQQEQQIVPLLQEELKQLGALKKNASLGGVQKVEELRKLATSLDEKIEPLLDPAQQQKFQALREQLRWRMIGDMGGEALHEPEGEVKEKL
jgi:hypothetical protein